MRRIYTILFNLAFISSYSNATQISDIQLDEEATSEIALKYKGKTVPYAVESGDTLLKIARKHYTTTQEIRDVNGFEPGTVINVGQILKVPVNTYFPADTIKDHTIAKGDTLEKIARKYSTTAEQIRKINEFEKGHTLGIGETIKVPSEIFTKEQKKEQIASIKKGISVKSDKIAEYTIAGGDTLLAIARKHYTTTQEIRDVNGLQPGEVLSVGRTIKVPLHTYYPSDIIENHIIKNGDTLQKIAKKYDADIDAIRKANELVKGQSLKVGTLLRIPTQVQENDEKVVSATNTTSENSNENKKLTIASVLEEKATDKKEETKNSEEERIIKAREDEIKRRDTLAKKAEEERLAKIEAEEAAKAAEAKKLEEEKIAKAKEEKLKKQEELAAAQKAEELKKQEELAKAEALKKEEMAKKAEAERVAKIEAEEAAKAAEAKKLEEEKIAKAKAEELKKQEELAKAEALKKEEMAKKAEAERVAKVEAEEAAKAAEAKKLEEEKIAKAKAEELKKQEELAAVQKAVELKKQEELAKAEALKKQEELAQKAEEERLARIKEEAIAKAKAFQEARLAEEKKKAEELAKIKAANTKITEPPAKSTKGELKIASLLNEESSTTDTNTTANTQTVADNGRVKRAEERGVEYTDYTIEAGDTLFTIARKHHTTIREVRQVNGLVEGDVLEPGSTLRVPMYTYYPKNMIAEYEIKGGDTLFSIARKHKTTVAEVRQFNDLKKGETLTLGRVLQVPTNTYSHDGSIEEEDLTDFDDLMKIKKKTRIASNEDDTERTKKKKTTEPTASNGQNVHKIKKGDSLYEIARKNNTTVDKLKKLNNIKSNKDLRIGKFITLPGTTRYARTHRGTDEENKIRKRRRIVIDDSRTRVTGDDAPKKTKKSFFSFMESLGSNSKQKALPKFAQKHLGKRYVYGASGPNNFDCSGFVGYVCKKNGVCLPRTAISQSRVGKYVAKSDLKPGDLIFFDTSRSRRGYVNHVGIYIGNGNFIHASSARRRVTINSLNSGFYAERFKWARRVNM